MRDGSTKGTRSGSLTINVNPLEVTGCLGEEVDARLLDLQPIGCRNADADSALKDLKG